MNASQINLKLIMPLGFSGKICPLYITDWVSVNRHYKQCTNKPLIGERSLANHINANFCSKNSL